MEKFNLETILNNAYNNCILCGEEKEYMTTEDVVVVVVSFKTAQTMMPDIYSSMAVRFERGNNGMILIKEQIKDYSMLKFIAMHEMGHIVHGDNMDVPEDIMMQHEAAADHYALEKGGFTVAEARAIVRKIQEPYLKAAVGCREEDRLKESFRIRLQNIK